MFRSIIKKIKRRTPGFLFDISGSKKESSIAIVLHFNQSPTPYFEIAYRVCYGPLLNMIEREDEIRFVLNFSMHFLLGIKKTQYGEKLIESISRKKNVLIADSLLNQGIMGVLDTGVEEEFFPERKNDYFWIPERCIDLEGFRKIASKGYKYTFSERRQNKMQTAFSLDGLTIFPEHLKSRMILNSYFMFGKNIYEVKAFLNSGMNLIFAEDAEVFGLWNYEKGLDHVWTHRRFKRILELIRNDPNIKTLFPHEMSFFKEDVEGSGYYNDYYVCSWIEDSFNGRINQFFEKGYENMYDFLTSERIITTRVLSSQLLENINQLNISEYIKNELKTILAVYLFELGCPGVSSDDGLLWNGIRTIKKYTELLSMKPVNIKESYCMKQRFFLISTANGSFYILDELAQIVCYINESQEVFLHDEIFHELNGKISDRMSHVVMTNKLKVEFDSIIYYEKDGDIAVEYYLKEEEIIRYIFRKDGKLEIKKRQKYIVENSCRPDFPLLYDDL